MTEEIGRLEGPKDFKKIHADPPTAPLIKEALCLVQIHIFFFSFLHSLCGMPSGLRLLGNGVNFEILFICVGQGWLP